MLEEILPPVSALGFIVTYRLRVGFLLHRGKLDVIQGQEYLFSLLLVGGKITGSVWVGGFPKDQASFSRIMGYCQQLDVHVPYVSPNISS